MQCPSGCAASTIYVLNIGLGRSSTSVSESEFEKLDLKIVSWYQLTLLAVVCKLENFVQKNNRPLQVELENGRFCLKNIFQSLKAL